ncbi:MAG TPA: cytochrome c3 family protein [Anaeromyxobacter sp.]|nr:cytochrome c3 family protein [Anaeromyxobacter sp.]
MAPRSEQRRTRAIALAAIAAAGALAACGPKVVAWPRTPPPERPERLADFDPQPLVARSLERAVVVHPPFRDNRCGSCHVSARGGGMLLASTERLCDGCHAEDVRRERPHAGARACLGCHSRHVSTAPGRIAGPAARMCRRCHDAAARKLVRAHQGYPVDAARCTRCHDPHGRRADGGLRAHVHRPARRCSNCHVASSEPAPLALIRPERETCGRCHPHADPRAEVPFEHAAFGAGCSVCHEPHASDRPHLLVAAEGAVCGGCHPEIAARARAGPPHPPAATGNCHACHSPHGAERPMLLVAGAPDLCTSCHARWHEGEDRAPSGRDNDRCVYCHDPHGSGKAGLLRRDPRVVRR